jgi:hypothetical protein
VCPHTSTCHALSIRAAHHFATLIPVKPDLVDPPLATISFNGSASSGEVGIEVPQTSLAFRSS